jgi:hypothetical protein
MIYCNLKGGLGNMLFQIAATKSFAIDLGVDCSFPNLNSQLHLINNDSVYNPKIKHSFEYTTLLKNLNTTPPKKNVKIIKFPFHYVKPPLQDDITLDGFFQSEKYFKHNKDVIFKYLDFSEISKIVETKYGDLLKEKTTSIHVRRGDYVRHPNHHPTQSMEYYNKSIDLLSDKTDKFVVFSDDMKWCKENFKTDNIIYIENEKDYIELYLMSLCDNNIIANSSFSWWGAWLNKNDDKLVVGPTKWFGSSINHKTSDILPDEWIKF